MRTSTTHAIACDDDVLLRLTETAEILQCSKAQAYRMAQRRLLPVVTFGRSVRVPRKALMEWIRSNTSGGQVAA